MKLPNYFWCLMGGYRWCAAFDASQVFGYSFFGGVRGDGTFHMLSSREKIDFVSMYCAGGEL
jgi:hypothetical protein